MISTNSRILFAYFRLFIGCWRHAEFGAEVAGEGVGTGKSAGLTDLLNGDVGLVVHQTDGIVEAQLTDISRQGDIVAALGEGGTNAIFRQTSTVDERLAPEVGL